MSKKQKGNADPKASIEPLSSLKIGIISFYDEALPAKYILQTPLAEFSQINGVSFIDRLRESLNSNLDYTLITFTQSSNLQFLEPGLKQMNANGWGDVLLFTSSDKNQSKNELISGFRTDELLSPAVLISNKLLQEQPLSVLNTSSKVGLLYSFEKLTSSWTNWQTDHADKTQTPEVTIASRLKLSTHWYNLKNSYQKPWKIVFMLLCALSLAAMTILSRDAAISGDEFTQFDWADTAIIPYYTDGKDAALSDPKKLMHLYGSSFDTFTALMARITGTEDVYEMRHFWNAIFGFICIFFTSLIIKRITRSYLYAGIGLILLFFTPRLLGDALNNPKDIPFAAGYLIALYYAIKYYSNRGRKPLSQFIGIITGISLAISIRIGGLVLLPIVATIAGFEYIRQIGVKSFLSFKWVGFQKLLLGFIIITAASFFIGIAPWPYGIEDPFTNPFKALKEFTNFGATLRQLFEGKLFDSDLLPRYYLVKYIAITLPLVSIAGVALFSIIAISKKVKIPTAAWYLVFAAVFPVFYIWFQKSNVYGGMRQVLFVIPCLVAIAVSGFHMLSNILGNKKWVKIAIPVSMLLINIPAASHIVKSHPMEYIYFNELAGGVKGAYGNYEMDYYLASLKPCTEWFLNNVARKNPNQKFVILTYGMDQVKYYCRKDTNVHVGFTRYDDRSEKKWDYAIFFNAYLDKDRLLSGKYPPVGTVYTPKIDGKPMGLVIKRPSFADFEGFEADRSKEYDKAVKKYKEYLEKDPNSNEVYLYLAYAYANLGKMDSAIWSANQSVKLYPEFTKALFALNQFYVGKGDYEKGIKVMDQYLAARPKDSDAHLIKGQTLAQKGDLNGAIQSIQQAIAFAPMDYRAYSLGAQIYQGLGDKINAGLYYDASKLFSTKDQNEYQNSLEALSGIYRSITGEDLDMSKYK